MTDLVKGANDYSGEEALKRERIKQILTSIFQSYGFEPAETPIIEYEEFVRGENQQDEAISDIFKLQDKGKRNLALRYELTFQLKRLAKNKKLPYKRYQIGEVFRDEPASSNRFRQFTQCDIDIIGSKIKDEAEILALVSRVLKDLNIEAVINFNNRKLLNEIMQKAGVKDNDKEQVIREIDKLDKLSEGEIKANLKKYKADKLLSIFKSQKAFFKKYDSYKEIEELEQLCRYYNIKANFQPSLARGLSYYNGSIFEIKTKEMKETICAGGSYLVNGMQSTGISFGLERISQLSKIKLSRQGVLIISISEKEDKDAIKFAEQIRELKLPCWLMYGKISKALEFANANSVPYVIFLGEEERKKKKLKLRDMKTGKESLLPLEKVIEALIKD